MEDTVKRTPADINLALRREGFRDVHELFNSLAMATLTPVSVDFSNNANMRATYHPTSNLTGICKAEQ
ncbi:MAG: hypothetical protein ABSE71_04015 [Candidatus Micrarchaeaceae archaeon]|jgi:hypothetical protein|nr:hypothetical protein [Candidatus Micrarchaeota archaeon]HII10333.1 hypothetical protein [Candidatus Micrarchaeota archaeon]